MINMFGGNHEEIGSLDRNLILKTSGKVKIQFGKKFIDLLDNNGNINVETKNIIRKVDSIDKISSNGFYYVNNELVAYINGTPLVLTTASGNIYVSFLEKQNVTTDLQLLALENIGFLYNSLEDVPKTKSSGIIYVEEKKSLYVYQNGVLTLYLLEIPNPYPKQFVIEKEDQTSEGSLVIKGNGIENGILFDSLNIYSNNNRAYYESKLEHIFKIGNSEILKINNSGVISPGIQSLGASYTQGYRIYKSNGEYTLDIDNINVRNGIPLQSCDLVPTEYYNEENILLSINEIEDSEEFSCSLKYTPSYLLGDILLIFAANNLEEETGVTLTPVELTVISVQKSSQQVTVKSNTDISNYNISNCIICLKERDSIINDDLVIGNIGNNYNSKEYGIISKLNLFYSTKFDKEGEGVTIYPYYSDQLYDELNYHINEDEYDNIIPPLGIIKSLGFMSSAEYDKTSDKIYFYDLKGNKLSSEIDCSVKADLDSLNTFTGLNIFTRTTTFNDAEFERITVSGDANLNGNNTFTGLNTFTQNAAFVNASFNFAAFNDVEIALNLEVDGDTKLYGLTHLYGTTYLNTARVDHTQDVSSLEFSDLVTKGTTDSLISKLSVDYDSDDKLLLLRYNGTVISRCRLN